MKKLILLAMLLLPLTIHAEEDGDTTCRDQSVKRQFDKMMGYPRGRKGFVVDHICALAQGGLDSVENMQYQSIAEGKEKDRVENTPYGKRLYCTTQNSTPDRKVFNCKGNEEKSKSKSVSKQSLKKLIRLFL